MAASVGEGTYSRDVPNQDECAGHRGTEAKETVYIQSLSCP